MYIFTFYKLKEFCLTFRGFTSGVITYVHMYQAKEIPTIPGSTFKTLFKFSRKYFDFKQLHQIRAYLHFLNFFLFYWRGFILQLGN